MSRRYETRFTMTLEDYRVLSQAYSRLTKPRRFARWIHLLADITLAAAAVYFAWLGEWALSIYFAVLAAFLAALGLVVTPWLRMRQFEHQRLGFSEVLLVADDEAISTATEQSNSRMGWGLIRRVDDLTDHVILWPNNRIGLIVPKRSFGSAQDVTGILELAREKTAGQTL